jgi:DNA-binding NtrC family response regulator
MTSTLRPKIVCPAAMETILLVDDRQQLRELVEVLLCRIGYRVITASDGASALRAAREQESIDLLLTDLEMPGMRGDALASQFARLHPRAGVIVSTTSTDAIETDVAYDFLPKPFGATELREGVRRTLRKRLIPNRVSAQVLPTAPQV